jgi:hypothetical protein
VNDQETEKSALCSKVGARGRDKNFSLSLSSSACACAAACCDMRYFSRFILIVLRSALNKMDKRKIPVTATEEITNNGRELGFDELVNNDVQELFSSRSEELSNDDLFLDQQTASEEAENMAEEPDNVQVKDFTLKEFEDNFRAVQLNLNYKYYDMTPESWNSEVRIDVHF